MSTGVSTSAAEEARLTSKLPSHGRAFAAFELLLLPEDRSMTPASFFIGEARTLDDDHACIVQHCSKTSLKLSYSSAK